MTLTKEQIDADLKTCHFLELATDLGLPTGVPNMKAGSIFKNLADFKAVYREACLGRQSASNIEAELEKAFGSTENTEGREALATISERDTYRLLMKGALLLRVNNAKGFLEPMKPLDSYTQAPPPIKTDFVSEDPDKDKGAEGNRVDDPLGYNPETLKNKTLDVLNAQVNLSDPKYFAEQGAFETTEEAIGYLSKNFRKGGDE